MLKICSEAKLVIYSGRYAMTWKCMSNSHEDSKLQGEKREEVIKTYIELRQKSNLKPLICACHLSDAQWTEIQPFLE